MNVEEWCEANPDVSKEQIVEELCQWRDRANKYKELFLNEAETSARFRSQLKECMSNAQDFR